MCRKQFLLLSFDVEEFDMPLEYGQAIPEKEQLEVGYEGLETLMEVVDSFELEATFFTTANFAQHFPETISSISRRHEIASHTFYHSRFSTEDLLASKTKLEEIISKPVYGLRMPRMRKVGMREVKDAGYSYDSSINPSFVPGRYNNLHLSRNYYYEDEMLRVPVSVSPMLRIPLFWLSFKNFPYQYYLHLVKRSLGKDGYVCLYFHPWEFINLDAYKLPGYTKRLAGERLQERLRRLIRDLGPHGDFVSMERWVKENVVQR
ncbi:MAG: polysaccharide deacetylase family protein [Flavisolibacter sp.]